VADLERILRVRDTELKIVGRANDTFLQTMPELVDEPALDYAALALEPRSVVIDAGANVGVLTIGFASLVPDGHVYAVEASPSTVGHLHRNVAGSGLGNVTVVNTALSDASGAVEFCDVEWYSAGSFVRKDTAGADVHEGSVRVPARTLDELVASEGLQRLDLVKIDVEGHELAVLRGARDALERFRPSAVVELNLFTVTSFGGVLPMEFLRTVRETFPFVYDFRVGESLSVVTDDHDIYRTVQRQFTTGRPSELICRFEPLPRETELRLHQAATSEARRRFVARASAEASGGADLVAALERELAAARAEIAALKSSTCCQTTTRSSRSLVSPSSRASRVCILTQ